MIFVDGNSVVCSGNIPTTYACMFLVVGVSNSKTKLKLPVRVGGKEFRVIFSWEIGMQNSVNPEEMEYCRHEI